MAKIGLMVGLAALGAVTGGLGLIPSFFGAALANGGLASALFGGILGFGVGNTVGNIVFPVKLPNQFGPRLGDLKVSTSTNGAIIPIGFGTFVSAVNIFWSPGLVEHSKTTKQSAKGGPSYSSTNYTYTASFAGSFGESGGSARVGIIKKIWFDTKVVYDSTTGANNSKYAAPTMYVGSQTQNPDPTIQAVEGVNRTSGYRGQVYAVWADFLLSDFGNRIPNIQALIDWDGASSEFVGSYDTSSGSSGSPGATITFPTISPVTASDWALSLMSDVSGGTPSGFTSIAGGLAYKQLSSGSPLVVTAIEGSGFVDWTAILASFKTTGSVAIRTSASIHSGGFSAGTFTNTISVLGGSAILVTVQNNLAFVSDDSGITIHDSQGNHYTEVKRINSDNSELAEARLFIAMGVTAGSVTVTAITTEFMQGTISLFEVTGITNRGSNSLAQRITEICRRSGVPSGDVDSSQIQDIVVGGYLLGGQSDAKSALQPLMAAFFVDAVESDFILKFVPRGVNASVMTIPEDDLGLVADAAKLTEEFAQEQELPREVEVLFVDADANYEQNKSQKKRSSRIVATQQKVTISLPIVLTPDQARQIAEKALYLSWLEGKPFSFNLWKAKYMLLDPTDVLQFVYQGNTYQMRVAQANVGAGYTIELSGVSETATAYNSSATGGTAEGNPTITAPPPAETILFLYDLPYLEDEDAITTGTGYYWAFSSASDGWDGGVLNRSSDDANFSALASSTARTFYGTTDGTLADPPNDCWTWDDTSTLTIDMAFGTLEASTDLEVLNGANPLIVGGEVLQFVNCTQTSPGVYEVSRLLRGRRNTEYAAFGHGADEPVIVPTTGLARAAAPLSLIGTQRYYRGVTVGEDISTVTSDTLTLQGNDLKPAEPVHLTGSRDGGNNLTIGWTRRTRYAGDWLNNSGAVPLNEVSEAYEIDILSGVTVVRTITWTGSYDGDGNPTETYSAANQTTDGLTPGDPVDVKIYQMSGTVGRGFPGVKTV